VIETGRPTAEVARDLGVNALLHRDEFGASLACHTRFTRARMGSIAARLGCITVSGSPLAGQMHSRPAEGRVT
jgi:hypothetical protein